MSAITRRRLLITEMLNYEVIILSFMLRSVDSRLIILSDGTFSKKPRGENSKLLIISSWIDWKRDEK